MFAFCSEPKLPDLTTISLPIISVAMNLWRWQQQALPGACCHWICTLKCVSGSGVWRHHIVGRTGRRALFGLCVCYMLRNKSNQWLFVCVNVVFCSCNTWLRFVRYRWFLVMMCSSRLYMVLYVVNIQWISADATYSTITRIKHVTSDFDISNDIAHLNKCSVSGRMCCDNKCVT